jgi:hypothetical protein
MISLREKISIIISVVFGTLFLGAMGFGCYWLPTIVNSMIDVKDNIGNRANITDGERLFVIIDAYAMIAVACIAVILLFLLLRVVYKQHVFSTDTVKYLSAISWCCYIEGLLTVILVGYFQLAVCVTLAACFLGFCIRVVNHVIREATRIKNENDFTI